MKNITVSIQLPDEQAMALAQLCKRINFSICRALSADAEETYTMLNSISELQKSLAEAGYNPR